MDINIDLGGFNLEFTIAGNPFHHKNNSDIIFCKNCHAFVLNFMLFNKAINAPEIEGLRFDLDFDFDFSLPVCLIGQFFDLGRCTDCDGCEVCEGSATQCTETCDDPECANCDSWLPNATCNDCSGNGVASLLNGVCECLDGFLRADPTSLCGAGGLPCLDLNVFDRCDRCNSDNGSWFGDCLSCKGAFFLQPFTRSCLDYCPSGSIGLLNICGEFPLGPVF